MSDPQHRSHLSKAEQVGYAVHYKSCAHLFNWETSKVKSQHMVISKFLLQNIGHLMYSKNL